EGEDPADHECPARHVLPAGRVRRGPQRRAQHEGRPGVHRLHARRRVPGAAARPDVRVPGRQGGDAAAGVGEVREGRVQPVVGVSGGHHRTSHRVAAAVAGPDLAMTRRRAGGRAGVLALAAIPLVVLVVFFVYPVLGIVGLGFVSDGHFAPGAVLEVLGRPRTGRVLWFTLWSAGLATLVTLLAGLPLAFVLHRLSFPGRGLLRALVVVPFVLPTVVVGVAFSQLVAPSGWLRGLHLEGTAAAIVAALAFFNVSVVVRTVGSFWESLDPRREQAAA